MRQPTSFLSFVQPNPNDPENHWASKHDLVSEREREDMPEEVSFEQGVSWRFILPPQPSGPFLIDIPIRHCSTEL